MEEKKEYDRDLRNQDLSGLSGINPLLYYDFENCDLQDASFWNSDLTNTSFKNSNLSGVTFCGANLTGADFRGADIEGSNFGETNLTGAKFDPGIFSTKEEEMKIISNILEILDSGKGKLDMRNWHTCETTHCVAGWLCPELGDPESQAAFLAPTATMYFYSDNETAMAALRRIASGEESIYN
jgi:hypothetical protein